MMNEHLPKHHKVLPWLIGVGAVILVGAAIFFMWWFGHSRSSNTNTTGYTQVPTNSASQNNTTAPNSGSSSAEIQWSFNGSTWQYMGQGANPPSCGSQIITQSPTNVSLATAILYPGQVRGGNYKPHGGFLFGNASTNNVDVVAPFDAAIYRGARYIEQGEVQYMLDFIAPCGIMYRLDHLKTLTSKFQTVADTFPAAGEMTSQTTNVSPTFEVKAGEKIATAVGFSKNFKNVSFDFGVYDLRSKNAASQSSVYTSKQGVSAELGQFAVCWLDWLPGSDAATVKALPGGDQKSGKTSDYCK